MKVSVQYAAEHFEELANAAYSGEAVEIASAGQPALQLVRSGVEAGSERVLGAGKALTHLPDAEELDRVDREWKRELEAKFLG